MKRRSFFKQLFGAVVGGLAAPHLAASAAESIVVIDPAAPFYAPSQFGFGFTGFRSAESHTMVGGAYAPDQPIFRGYPIEEKFYTPGETFRISGRPFEVPLTYEPRHYEVDVYEDVTDV